MIPKRIVYNSLIANHLQRSEEKTEKRNKEMLEAYRKAAAERAALGIPPLPLNARQIPCEKPESRESVTPLMIEADCLPTALGRQSAFLDRLFSDDLRKPLFI